MGQKLVLANLGRWVRGGVICDSASAHALILRVDKEIEVNKRVGKRRKRSKGVRKMSESEMREDGAVASIFSSLTPASMTASSPRVGISRGFLRHKMSNSRYMNEGRVLPHQPFLFSMGEEALAENACDGPLATIYHLTNQIRVAQEIALVLLDEVRRAHLRGRDATEEYFLSEVRDGVKFLGSLLTSMRRGLVIAERGLLNVKERREVAADGAAVAVVGHDRGNGAVDAANPGTPLIE